MPAPSIWGPPTWTLLHTMAEKINEDDFNKLLPQMFGLIKRICMYLPCPDCSEHATIFLAKLKPEQISTKIDFKNMLYLFHNMVNAKKKKPLYNYANMSIYQNLNIVNVFNISYQGKSGYQQ